jgi:hypothetical protein
MNTNDKKTGKELLETLPADIQDKWIENTKELNDEWFTQRLLDREWSNLHDFLSSSFIWHDALEGNSFWYKIAKEI